MEQHKEGYRCPNALLQFSSRCSPLYVRSPVQLHLLEWRSHAGCGVLPRQCLGAALDAVNNRSVTVKDKDRGRIETAWLEIPMPGRTIGAPQEELQDSKDRSRLILTVNRLDVEHVIRDIIRVF